MIAQDKYGAIYIDLTNGSHVVLYPESPSQAVLYSWSVQEHMDTYLRDSLKEVKGITAVHDPLTTLEVDNLVAYRDEDGFVVVVFPRLAPLSPKILSVSQMRWRRWIMLGSNMTLRDTPHSCFSKRKDISVTDDTITVTLPIEYDDDAWYVGAWGFNEVGWRDVALNVNHPDHPIAQAVVAHIDAVEKREAEAWRAAKPGEGWILTVDGVEGRYWVRDVVEGIVFATPVFSGDTLEPFSNQHDAASITAARLAWPLDGE